MACYKGGSSHRPAQGSSTRWTERLGLCFREPGNRPKRAEHSTQPSISPTFTYLISWASREVIQRLKSDSDKKVCKSKSRGSLGSADNRAHHIWKTGRDKMGEWIMKLVRGRVKNRKGCSRSQGSGSDLYPLKIMPIVEWVCLLKRAAMGSFTQKDSTAEILNSSLLLRGYNPLPF